ncbi:hypothetical protein FY034_05275 [Trichlorobacter lovleyi]|uniref:hypothetical protein n=1 Tax=Trichlorobacter lovleyi TaxID=313985 RepID=UPI002240DA76|nr:hypothetical protein [Trichlorobacter lovleyi]QOX78368.1 hypothetical protein FY034_05275 [Trichlorobacter lovleyi]
MLSKSIMISFVLLATIFITSCDRFFWRYQAKKQIENKNIEIIYDGNTDSFITMNEVSNFNYNDFYRCIKLNKYATLLKSNKFTDNIFSIETSDGFVHFSDTYFTKLDILKAGHEFISPHKDNKYTFTLGTQDVDIQSVKIIDNNTRLVEYKKNIYWNNMGKCFGEYNKSSSLNKFYKVIFHRYDDGWKIGKE